MALHFLKIKKKPLLFACRVGMWETQRVFHISTRFSFFASFFLFVRPPSFVRNLYRPNYRRGFKQTFPSAFDLAGLGMRLLWRHHVYATMRS